MRNTGVILLSVIILEMFFSLISCKTHGDHDPKRPQNVPLSAVWAGGVDGGNWYDCHPEKSTATYFCIIYDEISGSVISKGEFLLRKLDWDNEKKKSKYIKLDKPVLKLFFSSYDGINIHLRGDDVLVPNGWIIHPFNNTHGKKQEFSEGVPISDEIEY